MPTPIPQMASINIPEPRMVLIKPHDPSQLKAMEKAIRDSDLGVNPNNEGTQLRIHLPPMTEERRREMIERAAGRTTVPQLFIDGRGIGGSDELAALEASGDLDRLLGAHAPTDP